MAITFTAVSGAVVDTSDQLNIFEAYQKAFIVNGTIKKVLDFINDKLTIAVALTTPPLKGDTLTQATSGASMIVDFVSADKTTIYGYRTTTATFNTTNNVSSDNAGGDTMDPATFVPATEVDVSEGPHWYDWTKHPSKTTDLVTKLYLGCLYRGRAVVSGNPNDPYQWYMSRQGDPFDFDYTTLDAQTAVAGTNADAGKVGDIIKALIPWHDDFLIFGCASSMYIMQGDPAIGGELYPLSDTIGIFGDHSWTFDGSGNLWFWGTGGIYKLVFNGQSFSPPVNVSVSPLPNLIVDTGADPTTHRICLGYDPTRNGIQIAITSLATGTITGYWYDLNTEGFFPESYDAVNGVYSMYYYSANDPDDAGLLLGTTEGYVKILDDATLNDNTGETTAAIDSKCLFPVVSLSEDSDKRGKLQSVTIHAGGGNANGSRSDTDSITYAIHVEDDAETLVEDIEDGATALHTGTVTGPGRAYRIRKKARGAYMGIVLSNNTASETWAVEKLNVQAKASGKVK